MKTYIYIACAIIVIICISAVCIFSFDKDREVHTATSLKMWNLPIMNAISGVPVEYISVGSVVSDHRIDVSSRLSGYIREILVQEGDKVHRGQILARIDASDVYGGIRQSRAGVAAAEAAFKDTQADLERFQRLYDRESVSENEYRKIRLKYDAARETLNQARAAFDTARAQRDYAEIRSPVDGTVVTRAKFSGDMALPGAPILILEAGHKLVFETFVAEEAITSISVGQVVEVRLDRIITPVQGTVSRVVHSADPVTRSYKVKITLPQDKNLMSGMFGRAAFPIAESKAPVIPKICLIERGGLRGVFVVDNRNIVHFRWLRIGREWQDRVEATAGLQVGERLVAAAEPALRDGDIIAGGNAVQ